MSDASTMKEDTGFENLSQDDISRIVAEMQMEGGKSPSEDPVDSTESSHATQEPTPESEIQDPSSGDPDSAKLAEVNAEMNSAPEAETAAAVENGAPSADGQFSAQSATPVSDQTESLPQSGETLPNSASEPAGPALAGVAEAGYENGAKPVALTFEQAPEEPPEPRSQAVKEDDGEHTGEVFLREMRPDTGRRRYLVWLTGGLVGLIALGLAVLWGMNAFGSKDDPPPSPVSSHAPDTAGGDVDQLSASAKPTAGEAKATDSEPSIYGDRIDASLQVKLEDFLVQNKGLREELLIKKGEIDRLQQHYQKGIEQVEAAIIEAKAESGIKSFEEALNNKKIELSLKTIQRRNLYIRSLDQPSKWLAYGSEELLYTQRCIEIEQIAASVSDQIDLEGWLADGQALNRRYMIDADKLTVDLRDDQTIPVKTIWGEIVKKEKQVALSRLIPVESKRLRHQALPGTSQRNTAIWEEICNGDFSRKSQMTALSAAAAKCLAYCNDTDMFLNRLNDISLKTARQLFQWKGNWIGLNGLKSLPPEVAPYLFGWSGNWISLNGLHTLSAAATRHLRQWPGRRLELMGLDFQALVAADPQVLQDLRQWQKSGGTLYVSPRVQQLLRRVPRKP